MREIKFRCWDGKKMWPYAVPVLGRAYNGGTIYVSDHPNGGSNEFVNGELIQFTGLKDANGVEIYESDIVELFGHPREVTYAEGWFIPVVRVEYGYNAIDYYDPSLYVVKGNIWQNPELLNPKVEE